jgi:hypothetical protein
MSLSAHGGAAGEGGDGWREADEDGLRTFGEVAAASPTRSGQVYAPTGSPRNVALTPFHGRRG